MATRRTGPVIVLVLTSITALASDEAAIERCARSASLSERVACLEAFIRDKSTADPTAVESADAALKAEASSQAVSERVPAKAAQSTPEAVRDARSSPRPADKDDPTIDVVIVDVGSTAYGKAVFTTASGEIWQQTDTSASRRRAVPFDAEIRSGASGSFFLRPKAGGVAVRVRRTR